DLTKETFLAAMKKAGPVKLPVLGTLDMNKSAGIAGQPRIVNGKAILLRFTGTKFKVLSGFFDPYTL
ncbi:MAG: hypothetical protein JWO68_3969, partial [Actinomycetia bacterium]|nr:hypothetical protein [Actinomycetes bacterium]